jgi:hypothetical protein
LSRNIWRHGDNNGIIIISLIWSLYGFIIVQWGKSWDNPKILYNDFNNNETCLAGTIPQK